MPLKSDDFADYVEAVFRRQNEVAAELAFAIDDEGFGTERLSLLENAESELTDACRGLNQLSEERDDGETIGGLSGLKRARSAPDCERATEEVSELLFDAH